MSFGEHRRVLQGKAGLTRAQAARRAGVFESLGTPSACHRPGPAATRHGAARGDLLALEVDYHEHLAKRVAQLPGVRLHQAGDRERTYLFPVHLFDQVAEIVKPRRRRKCVLSPEQLARLAEHGRQATAERAKSKHTAK
jgi:hypothetical protein